MIALWDTNHNSTSTNTADDNEDDDDDNIDNHNDDRKNNVDDIFVDPVLSWKAHSGRWIADAKFLPGSITPSSSSSKATTTATDAPSCLITAGNDGTVCLWDLSTVSFSTGAPKLLHRTGKAYHSSGIFCMDVSSSTYNNTNTDRNSDININSNSSNTMICTGSKDKSVAVSSLESLHLTNNGTPMWRSRFHTAKVGDVKLQSPTSTVLASASDDGLVALHDYRMNGAGSASESSSSWSSSLVAKLEDAHDRPHSVLWDPCNKSIFVTAGLDPIIKVWDQRNLSKPIASLQGHVPTSTGKCKKIHRPIFFFPRMMMTATTTTTTTTNATGKYQCLFLLTGGQGSSSVSMYQMGYQNNNHASSISQSSLFSRGKLPVDSGDSGCIAVNGKQVAVAVDQGEIIILEPSTQ